VLGGLIIAIAILGMDHRRPIWENPILTTAPVVNANALNTPVALMMIERPIMTGIGLMSSNILL
jgi:hypothetical protein